MASNELTEMVYTLGSEGEVLKAIKYFAFLVDDESAQKRRIGLYGIGSISVGLYHQNPMVEFLDFMQIPVLGGNSLH